MTDSEASYTYGMVTLNNGERFRARKNDETEKVAFMSHSGPQNASGKVSKTFKPGYDAMVPSPNRYRFPDEYLNQNMSQTSSKDAEWKLH